MDPDNDADAEPPHEGFEQASKNDASVPIPTSSTASDISIYSSVLFIREPLLGLRQFAIRLVNCIVARRLKKIRLSEPQVTKSH